MTPAPSEHPDTVVIRLRLVARLRRAMLINDIMPGALVLVGGVSMLDSGIHTAIVFANIVAGGALIVFGVKEWLSHDDEAESVNWVDVFGGIVMLLEAVAMYKPWKGFQPAVLYGATACVIVARGLFPSRFPRGRTLVITPEGFRLRAAAFSKRRFAWSDISSISCPSTSLTVTMRDGTVNTVSLSKIENTGDVVDALTIHGRRHGVVMD